MTSGAQSTAPLAMVLLMRHLGLQPTVGTGSALAQVEAAVADLSDSQLDAYIRYFGQAGSEHTTKAAEILAGLMLRRLEREFPRST